MGELLGHFNHVIVIVLMMTGFYTVIARPNLVKKIVGLFIFQTSVFILFISMANVEGASAPIISSGTTAYSNPLPHVMILTAIVVSVATTALGLAIVVRIKEAYGTINKALDPQEIGPFVEALAKRIALWTPESINACKQAVYASIDKPIEEALKEEAYWLYQATSQTPALKRFTWADDNGAQFDMNNQRAWEDLVVGVQEIK